MSSSGSLVIVVNENEYGTTAANGGVTWSYVNAGFIQNTQTFYSF
jgi:hypothetical protein